MFGFHYLSDNPILRTCDCLRQYYQSSVHSGLSNISCCCITTSTGDAELTHFTLWFFSLTQSSVHLHTEVTSSVYSAINIKRRISTDKHLTSFLAFCEMLYPVLCVLPSTALWSRDLIKAYLREDSHGEQLCH